MPDIKLGTLELTLAKDSKGVRAFQFLHAPDEPGEPGRVGTIVFDQLHHGIGAELSLVADRYSPENAVPPSTFEPGILRSGSTPVSLATGETIEQAVGDIVHQPSSFQVGGDVFFVLPRKVVRSVGGTATPTTVFTPSASNILSGEAALYDGEYWFGIQSEVTDQALGHVHFDGTTWVEQLGGLDNKATMFLAVHGGMFALVRSAQGWFLQFTDAASPTLATDWVSIALNLRSPIVTAIKALGRFILVLGQDGEVVMVADAKPVKSLVPQGTLAESDVAFGHGAKPWGADLLIQSERGLYALNLDRLAGRDVSPLNIQGHMGKRRFRPSALTPMGLDMLVGTRQGTDDAAAILVLRRYPEGVFYNHVIDVLFPVSGNRVRAMEYLDTGILTYLHGGTGATGRIEFVRLSDSDGAKPSIINTSVLLTSSAYGPFTGRKLSLQVRGFYGEATTAAAELKVVPDRETAVSAGTFNAAGPFTLTGARVVGTVFALEITLPSDAVWPRLLLPLMLDYVEEPRAGDRIRIAVEAPVGQRRVDAGGVSAEKFLKDLRDLRNNSTTITLELLDVAGTPSTFAVLVEAVSSVEERPMLKREFPSAVAFVDLRVA